jgi:hypothetical protein
MSDRILHVNRARHVRGYLLEIDFDDGTRKVVDVTPLLTGEVFEPLREQDFFARLTIDPVSRTIVWPNGADLAPEALYKLPAVHRVA